MRFLEGTSGCLRHKRKYIFIAFSFIVLIIMLLIIFRRTPYSIARQQLGFRLNKTNIIDTFSEKWYMNGDGYIFIVFSVPYNEIEKIKNECIDNKFCKLPIIVDNPSTYINPEINKLISKSDSSGYYQLQIDSTDKKNCTLSVFSIKQLKLIICVEVF